MTASTRRLPLEARWQVEATSTPAGRPSLTLPPLPAEVPGCIHLDLQRGGVIPDPFARLHERDVAWVDDTDWLYRGTFSLDSIPAGDLSLRFGGLDTVAEISLNGERVAGCDNMFVPFELRVNGRLVQGENELSVLFHAAGRVGRERQAAWEAANACFPHDPFIWSARSFVRKAQYMFGWDWGPVLISCGIWRPIELVAMPIAAITSWSHRVDFSGDGAAVTVQVEMGRAGGAGDEALTLVVDVGDGRGQAEVPRGETAAEAVIPIRDVRRWSPESPNLYPLTIRLLASGEEIDRLQQRIGLRTIELIQEPDADGSSFLFRINGENLFCKGANWIPADSFPARAYDNEPRLRQLLEAARNAGYNMLRVWGGGMYESETFYDLCGELGLLVWQDFPYACAYYPDSEDYLDACRREAEAAVKRIRNHASLALWCGNNENQELYAGNWQGLSPPRFVGAALYDQVLPAVVAAEDPRTPYWPGSPDGGPTPNSPDAGDRHNWDVWHAHASDGDWPHYRQDRSRFCSEFGFASSCGPSAWNQVLAPADRAPASVAVQWHCKTGKPYDIYLGYIERHFPPVRTLDDLIYYSELNQAEAMRCAVEHYRRNKGRCWGTLIWQHNDCWPVQSWALIDYTGEEKAAYHAARRFYAPVLLCLTPADAGVSVAVVNDLRRTLTGTVWLRLLTFTGDLLHSWDLPVKVGANAVAITGPISPDVRGRSQSVYLWATGEMDDGTHVENLHFFAEPKDLQVGDPDISLVVDEGARVTLTADTFAPYVWLSAPDLGPLTWSDNFFHLQAGQTRTIAVTGRHRPSKHQLTSALRVRRLCSPAGM